MLRSSLRADTGDWLGQAGLLAAVSCLQLIPSFTKVKPQPATKHLVRFLLSKVPTDKQPGALCSAALVLARPPKTRLIIGFLCHSTSFPVLLRTKFFFPTLPFYFLQAEANCQIITQSSDFVSCSLLSVSDSLASMATTSMDYEAANGDRYDGLCPLVPMAMIDVDAFVPRAFD
jgi:hypothetical protein